MEKQADNTQEQRIESPTKHEILKREYETYFSVQKFEQSNLKHTYSKIAEAAMQEYADLRCKPLVEALEKIKGATNNSAIRIMITKALQDYKK